MKKVMIIGGSGFLGLNLIEKFLENNYKIIVYDMNEPKIKNDNIIYIKGNLNDLEEKLSEIKKIGIEQGIYLVNNIPVNGEVENFEQLIEENKKVINLLYTVVNRVIFFSSGGRIYKNSPLPHREEEELYPTCQYGKGKVRIESYLHELYLKNNKDYLIIRPSNPYGKYQNINGNQGVIAVLIGKIIKNQAIEIWGTGSEIRDYIYVKDFTEIFYKIFEKEKNQKKIYNIGTGKGEKISDILEIIKVKLKIKSIEKKYLAPKQKHIKTNILSTDRIFEEIGSFKYLSIEEGIGEFIKEIREEAEIEKSPNFNVNI